MGRTMRLAAALMAAFIPPTMAACKGTDSGSVEAGNPAATDMWSLTLAICRKRGSCTNVASHWTEYLRGALVGVSGCDGAKARMFGSWRVDDASSRSFGWSASVPPGAVFASLNGPVAALGCEPPDDRIPLATTRVAYYLTGLDWAELEGDDVFVPFDGQAIIDHEVHARATLDAHGDASPPRVTISVESADVDRAVHPGLGQGDVLPIGRYEATVVRVIEPQSGFLAPIGWVEIKLAEGLDAGGHRIPDAGRDR
jgi:hypothetical protein